MGFCPNTKPAWHVPRIGRVGQSRFGEHQQMRDARDIGLKVLTQ